MKIIKHLLSVLCVIVCIISAFHSHEALAVIIAGSGDPSMNTTAPTGTLENSGWQYEGYWGGFAATPIAPQYFIAAKHVGGSVGQKFYYAGYEYTTTAFYDDIESDLRIWKTSGIFPMYAPLYSGTNELARTMLVTGRGTQRGSPVIVSNVVTTTYVTNIVDMKSLGMNKGAAKKEFPEATFKGQTMTVITATYSTNDCLRGWKFGASDGVMRWGTAVVTGVGSFLSAAFSTNEFNSCFLSSGDSSGGDFIRDTDGLWKLAAVNYGIEGPWSYTSGGAEFYAALFDESGLYNGAYQIPFDGIVRPASFYCTRISPRLGWIRATIGQ